MYGIVTIIEGQAGRQVHALWQQWREQFGEQAVQGMSVPHVSYHVADDYDLDAVRALFEGLATHTRAFEVRAAGVAFIAGANGDVVWINVARSPAMNDLHEALWDGATAAGADVEMRYESTTWFPHVTLTYQAQVLEDAPELASAMRDGRLPRAIVVDNLALIEETDEGHDVVLRVPLPDPLAPR